LTGKKYQLGLIGWPLTHSLSPAIHRAALDALGLEGEYGCFPVEPMPEGEPDLVRLMDQLREGVLHGLNVTLPHKEIIIDRIDRLTLSASQIGAVNTIYKEGEELVGDNTDRDGFLLDLENTLAPEAGTALVLGAGGSARAVVSGLSDQGWTILVAARRLEQAKRLTDALQSGGGATILPITLDSGSIGALGREVNLIINTTPVGMSPDVHASPWPKDIPFPQEAILYDLVYTPRQTQLVQAAQSAGLLAESGLGMLAEQAALSFERWTRQRAPRLAMRQAAKRAVEGMEDRGVGV
jgi:shikimate dehydrogenase